MNKRMKMFGVVAVSVLTGCVADPSDVDDDVEVRPDTALHTTTDSLATAEDGTAVVKKLPGRPKAGEITLTR